MSPCAVFRRCWPVSNRHGVRRWLSFDLASCVEDVLIAVADEVIELRCSLLQRMSLFRYTAAFRAKQTSARDCQTSSDLWVHGLR